VGVVTLLVALALLVAFMTGLVVGAWAALEWMRRLRPGRESDLIAELAALRASARLHEAALASSSRLWQAAARDGSC